MSQDFRQPSAYREVPSRTNCVYCGHRYTGATDTHVFRIDSETTLALLAAYAELDRAINEAFRLGSDTHWTVQMRVANALLAHKRTIDALITAAKGGSQ